MSSEAIEFDVVIFFSLFYEYIYFSIWIYILFSLSNVWSFWIIIKPVLSRNNSNGES